MWRMTLAEAAALAAETGMSLNCRLLDGELGDAAPGCGLTIITWLPGTAVRVIADGVPRALMVPAESAARIAVEVSDC